MIAGDTAAGWGQVLRKPLLIGAIGVMGELHIEETERRYRDMRRPQPCIATSLPLARITIVVSNTRLHRVQPVHIGFKGEICTPLQAFATDFIHRLVIAPDFV